MVERRGSFGGLTFLVETLVEPKAPFATKAAPAPGFPGGGGMASFEPMPGLVEGLGALATGRAALAPGVARAGWLAAPFGVTSDLALVISSLGAAAGLAPFGRGFAATTFASGPFFAVGALVGFAAGRLATACGSFFEGALLRAEE